MEGIKHMILLASLSLAMGARAQFYTVGKSASPVNRMRCGMDSCDIAPVDSVARGTSANPYSCLSAAELEEFVKRFEKLVQKKGGRARRANYANVLSFYSGEAHELTPRNIWKVCDEVGVTHKNYVIAQSILETGRYRSRVCREYNNIFGLYDSRRGDYYHFARWEDSVVAYRKFIQYKFRGGKYLDFLKSIGYAEDPYYEAKLRKIMSTL